MNTLFVVGQMHRFESPTLKTSVTLTPGLGVIQGYWKGHQSIDRRLPIYLAPFLAYLISKNAATLKSWLEVIQGRRTGTNAFDSLPMVSC